jgi:ABC-type Fe3+ transport system substrate-binding protein
LGTWLSSDPKVREKLVLFKKGGDGSLDPPLLPAHLLLIARSKNSAKAKEFAEWLVSRAGQAVVAKFKKNDRELYSSAPKSE